MMIELHQRVPQLAHINPYRTGDLDAARHHISKLFAPHQLDVVGAHQVLDVCISRARIEGGISFVYHRHGASVRVQPQPLKNFFLLQLPIRGEATVRIDAQEVHCSPQQAVMISPESGVDMRFARGCEQLIVRVEKVDLERHLEQLLGRRLDSPLAFAPAVPMMTTRTKEVTDLLALMTMSLTSGKGMSSSAIVRKQMAALLLSGLLSCLKHNYWEELRSDIEPSKPVYVSNAQSYMQRHLGEAVSPEEIASAVHVSARALFAGFKEHLNTTPMRYLKDLRLLKVYKSLASADARRTSVTAIAMEYGFYHLGHFCAAYKAKFGELPHETLNKVIN